MSQAIASDVGKDAKPVNHQTPSVRLGIKQNHSLCWHGSSHTAGLPTSLRYPAE